MAVMLGLSFLASIIVLSFLFVNTTLVVQWIIRMVEDTRACEFGLPALMHRHPICRAATTVESIIGGTGY